MLALIEPVVLRTAAVLVRASQRPLALQRRAVSSLILTTPYRRRSFEPCSAAVGRRRGVITAPVLAQTPSCKVAGIRPCEEGKKLRLSWADGHESSYHAVWLRHNCRCSACTTSINQKTIGRRDLESNTRVTSSTITGGKLKMVWTNVHGHHEGHIELDWLREKCYSEESLRQNNDRVTPLTTTSIPILYYDSIMNCEKELFRWLQIVNEYGLCLVKDIPPKDQEIKRLGEQIAPIQENTFLPAVFDVVATDNSNRVSDMCVELGMHMDLVYYESPPGIQLLHCLSFDPCVTGGESLLLDAYPVLESLRQEHPTHFRTLATVPATFQNIYFDSVKMTYRRPHISLDRDNRIVGMKWAPLLEGPLCVPEDQVLPYYEAYYHLWRMFEESTLKVTHRLVPGEALVFNNHRFIHDRASFELNGGARHLQGIYINIDEYKNKLQTLAIKFNKDFVAKNVFNHCWL